MKKEEAIMKINKLGNVGNIIVRIMKVLAIVGFVFTLVGFILIMALPKDLVTWNLGSTMEMKVNASELDQEGKTSMLQGITDALEEDTSSFSMNMNGSEYKALSVIETEAGMVVEAAVDTYSVELGDSAIACILGAITFVALYITLIFAGKLCQAFRDCESPFEENVVKQLSSLAYSLLPWVILGSLTESITESIFTNNFNIMIGVDLGMVLIIIFIFVLAYIFKYGAVLQQESDETL